MADIRRPHDGIADEHVSFVPNETRSGIFPDGTTLTGGNVTGMTVGGATDKVGYFGAAPIAKPTAVAVTVAGVHAALVSLGLIAA